jgi:hypothetical protein
MMLSRILPSREALDLRTFECGKCAHVEKVLVASLRGGRFASMGMTRAA